jgi:hypothetical protein
MNDTRQFAIFSARLDALRKHIPSFIDEPKVRDYHSIVDGLQTASGEDLQHFRIPESEVKPKVISVTRGSYSGGSGRISYSDKKYCDQTYFRRQVEALWQYLQAIKESSLDKPQTEASKDYWSMNDDQLERLAQRFNLFPVSRTENHLFVDRDRIIDALIRRDEGLRAASPPPQTNVIQVENMYGPSNIQQGAHGSNATINYKSEGAELKSILTQIQGSIENLQLSPAAKGQLQVDIDTIGVQLSATNPKPSIISECLHSVKTILEHAAGHVLAIGFLAELGKFGG